MSRNICMHILFDWWKCKVALRKFRNFNIVKIILGADASAADRETSSLICQTVSAHLVKCCWPQRLGGIQSSRPKGRGIKGKGNDRLGDSISTLYLLLDIYKLGNGGQSKNNLAPLQQQPQQQHYEMRYKSFFLSHFLPIDKTPIIVSRKWTGKLAAQCVTVIAPVSNSHLYAWISIYAIRRHQMSPQSKPNDITSLNYYYPKKNIYKFD